MTTIARTEHVSKWYGEVVGLNDVTVSIPAGITGLLGPNGAGTSTLLKLLTGQLRPSKGTVTVFGEPIWNNPRAFVRIGYCPDHDGFYERMSGLEWLTALASLSGVAAPERAAREALALVDLESAATKRIGAYSKGMRQRVKLAQAIVHDPDLLILDEPLSGMDPLARRRTVRLFREWGEAGKSVLVSSHILHEVEALTPTVLLINHGRILAEGDVHQIRALIDEHPHTVFVRSSDPRELARRLLSHDDVLSLRFGDGSLTIETARPEDFYLRLTELAATREAGTIEEVTSPDDNLQAVFKYLVRD